MKLMVKCLLSLLLAFVSAKYIVRRMDPVKIFIAVDFISASSMHLKENVILDQNAGMDMI